MKVYDAIELLEEVADLDDSMYQYNTAYMEALQMAIGALKKQEQERWRLYPAEKPKGGEIVLAVMPAYTDRNGEEHLFGGVICAHHIDNCRGGRWGRSDGVTYGALGLCDVDPVAWRPIPSFSAEDGCGRTHEALNNVSDLGDKASKPPEHADVVQVVRCKDCERCEYDAAFGQLWCKLKRIVRPDGYCDYGKRREG